MTLPDMESVARVCWEANRALQVRDGEELPDEPWDAAPGWRRDGLLTIVEAIARKEIRWPDQSHHQWWLWMALHGWEYGEVKDAHARTHPSLRPWNELTPRQQLAQRLNVHIVQEVMASERLCAMLSM